MNIPKVVTVSGAAVLAIAAVFAGKPRAGAILQLFYTVANQCESFSLVSGTTQFTTGTAGLQASIKTGGGTHRNLWGTCIQSPFSVSHAVHFKH